MADEIILDMDDLRVGSHVCRRKRFGCIDISKGSKRIKALRDAALAALKAAKESETKPPSCVGRNVCLISDLPSSAGQFNTS